MSDGSGYDIPDRILVVTAHPDDVDFGCAGSIARWTDAGASVSYCIVTDGDAGGFDPDVPRDQIAGIRRAEQIAAGAEVGVTDIRFLGYADGYLEVSLGLRRDITKVIRDVRPDRVVIQSPVRRMDFVYASHPDHLAAGEAAYCAVYPDSRNPFWYPELVDEGFEPWTVNEVWVMSAHDADTGVDITDTLDRKVAALLRHESQMTDPGGLPDRMKGWAALNAERLGRPSGELVEAFKRVVTS